MFSAGGRTTVFYRVTCSSHILTRTDTHTPGRRTCYTIPASVHSDVTIIVVVMLYSVDYTDMTTDDVIVTGRRSDETQTHAVKLSNVGRGSYGYYGMG